MAEKMTLERAKAVLHEVEIRLDSVASAVSDGYAEGMRTQLRNYRMALAVIDAHLAQPAQAVDVGALRETLFRIAADNHKSALTLGQEGLRGQCIQTSKELHEITRAIGNASTTK